MPLRTTLGGAGRTTGALELQAGALAAPAGTLRNEELAMLCGERAVADLTFRV
jgi:hypothetical protein